MCHGCENMCPWVWGYVPWVREYVPWVREYVHRRTWPIPIPHCLSYQRLLCLRKGHRLRLGRTSQGIVGQGRPSGKSSPGAAPCCPGLGHCCMAQYEIGPVWDLPSAKRSSCILPDPQKWELRRQSTLNAWALGSFGPPSQYPQPLPHCAWLKVRLAHL